MTPVDKDLRTLALWTHGQPGWVVSVTPQAAVEVWPPDRAYPGKRFSVPKSSATSDRRIKQWLREHRSGTLAMLAQEGFDLTRWNLGAMLSLALEKQNVKQQNKARRRNRARG